MMAEKYFPQVLAIVVTWNPNLPAFISNVQSYARQCRVLIVDNGSDEAILNELQCLRSEQCDVLSLGRNLGIAKAINEGVRKGCKHHGSGHLTTYFLFLDQDSVFTETTLSELVQASLQLQESGISTPVVGPVPINKKEGVAIGMYKGLEKASAMPPVPMESIYTSGMLVPSQLAAEAPQLEKFFIDYVDTEWCYRARNNHAAAIYSVPRARIYHQVGEGKLGLGLFRKQPLLIHKPIRQYFQLRNAAWMLNLPYIPLQARLKIFTRCFARVAILSLFVAPRRVRFGYLTRALIDGFVRRPIN